MFGRQKNNNPFGDFEPAPRLPKRDDADLPKVPPLRVWQINFTDGEWAEVSAHFRLVYDDILTFWKITGYEWLPGIHSNDWKVHGNRVIVSEHPLINIKLFREVHQ